jgi:endogenous inhibitor of DNA gyrase (YacG/DUF329 family)
MMNVRCPICERSMQGSGPREWPHWPFCSRRCQLIDLGRWLGGTYRIEAPLEGDEESAPRDALKPAVPSADPHSNEAL